jgi:hypothetical protein
LIEAANWIDLGSEWYKTYRGPEVDDLREWADIFRQQYQSTTNLSSFFEEDSAAVERLSREFAQQLVADVLEGF